MALFIYPCLVMAILTCLFFYWKRSQSYWKRKNLEYQEPHFLFGNFREVFMKHISVGEQFLKIYNQFKSRGLKHGGSYLFFKPVYVPVDLELIKLILRKDFKHFINRGLLYVNEESDPLSGHLFNLEDEKWKRMRTKLGPSFSPGKIRMMFQTLVACTSDLKDVIEAHSINKDALDIKEIVSCYTTDVICSTAFGVNCNCLTDPDAEFRKWGRRYFNPNFISKLKLIIPLLIPKKILSKIGYKQTGGPMEKFFMNMVKNVVHCRETNNIYRKDFIHLLLQLKNRGNVFDDGCIFKDEKKISEGMLTFNEIAAQCFVFFLGGFETSATTMTFALLELALNLDIQEKLRKEINTVLKNHGGQLTYEAIMEMTYLDKVVHETLRKHVPVPFLSRICKSDYNIPDTNLVLEAGTIVYIPVMAIHKDPDYYPEPDKFDPERFNEENKVKRHPLAFMPFGEGPRICIGVLFALLQIKVGLASILSSYKVTLNKKTQMPIKYSSTTIVLDVIGDVWINVENDELN